MKMEYKNVYQIFMVLLCVVVFRVYGTHPSVLEANMLCGFHAQETVITCEKGTIALQCDSEKHIKIVTAVYGRTHLGSAVCPSSFVKTIDCRSQNSTQITADWCDGKKRCHLMAIDRIYGNPCPGTSKYLEVKFCCM